MSNDPNTSNADRSYIDHNGPAQVKDRRWSDDARNGLAPALPPGTAIFDPDDVVAAVAPAFGLTVEDLRGPRRTRHVSEARDAAYYIIRRHVRMGFQRMAECMGRADHSGVVHAVRRAAKRRETDDWFRETIDRLERELELKAKGEAAA